MNKTKNKIIFAVTVSLILHLAFFVVSKHIVLQGMGITGDESRKIFRMTDVSKTPEDANLFSEKEKKTDLPDRDDTAPLIETIIFDQDSAPLVQQKDLAFEKKKEKASTEKTEAEKLPGEAVKAEDLTKQSQKSVKQQTAPASRVLNDAVLSRGPSSLSGAPRLVHEEAGYNETLSDPGESASAITAGDRREVSAGGGEFDPEKAVERVGRYEDMTAYLDVELSTYQNPATGEKFFRAHVGVRKGVRIEAMPKDITFLVDSSKSLTDIRFEEVKRGLSETLKNLGEKDTFNIVAFKNEQTEFSSSSVQATSDNIRRGRDFINALSAEGRTNISEALLRIIKTPAKTKPSYIFLVSDGRPNVGMTGAREIIREITRINKGQRPVFAFGVGLRVNTYFLDFISYQNRAWSEFARASDSAGRDLGRMYDNIKEPLLTDLRYRMTGLGSEDVFPKELPDFYHSKGFTVYGQYWDEDVFSMQVLGEAYGKVKEFIFKRKLSEAKQGKAEIEKAWAFSKIYNRIGMETMGKGDPGRIASEIEFLSRKYGINVPHLDETEGPEGAFEE